MAVAREPQDLLFVRYQKEGDPDLLARVFDCTAPRLLRLAFHLCADPAGAEDLVQATFVTAIEKAGQFTAGRPVLPWLTGILQHHAQQARSKASRRVPQERLGPRPVATPAEHAESRELDEAVARALDRLPDLYRPVMVLKLRHGLKPAQIADALGRSPGQVRVQIHRGTELLRNCLPVGLALSTAFGLTPTLGLAAMRGEIHRLAAVKYSLTAPAVGIGGILMKKTTTALIGALVLTGAALYVATDSGPAPLVGDGGGTAPAPMRAPTAGAPLAAELELPSTEAPAAPAERRALPVVQGAAGGAILVRALWEDDRSPAAGIGFTLRPHDGRHPDLYTERRVTGRDGRVRFGDLGAGAYGVYVDRAAKRPEDVAITGAEAAAELWIPALGEVSVDRWGRQELVLAELALKQAFEKQTVVYRSVQAASKRILEPDGVLRSRVEKLAEIGENEAGDRLSVEELEALLSDLRASSRLPDEEPVAVETVAADVVEVEVLVSRGLVVEGRVVDPEGQPVEGAEVWVRGRSREDAHLLGRSAGDGAFRLAGMEADSRVWARAPGFLATPEVRVRKGSESGLELRFTERAAAVRAVVVDSRGEPVVGASVRIGDPGGEPKPIFLRSDAEGRVAGDGIRPGQVPVLVLAPGYQPHREVLEIRAGADDEPERIFALDPGWIAEGQVRSHAGEGQEGVTVFADAEGRPTTEVTTGPDGSFRLECLPPGPVTLRVEEGEHRGLRVPIQGSSGEVQRHDLVLPPWGRIAGRLVDEQGRPLEGWRVQAVPVGAAPGSTAHKTRSGRSDEHGAFELETEPDHRYRLEAWPSTGEVFSISTLGGKGAARLRFVADFAFHVGESSTAPGQKRVPITWLGEVPGVQEDLEVVIPAHLVPSARLRGRLLDAAGNPLSGSIQIHVDGGSRSERLDAQGGFDIGPLIPGDYDFQVVSRKQEFPTFYLDVAALAPNQTVDLGAVVPPLGGVLSVSVVDGRAEQGPVTGRVLDRDGRPLATLKSLGPPGHSLPLPPGEYTVQVLREGEVLDSQSARVLPRETTHLPIVLR